MSRHDGRPSEMTLTAHCAGCGQVFEYPASILANGTTPRWCEPRCRDIAKRARWLARHTYPCAACGADADPSTRSHGVGLCRSCNAARWLSCQSKIRHPSEPDARAATWADAPHCYPCPICRGWHVTAMDLMHEGWHVTVAAVAAAMARLEAEQGWVWLHPSAPDSRQQVTA